jgi:hypothetical protein
MTKWYKEDGGDGLTLREWVYDDGMAREGRIGVTDSH